MFRGKGWREGKREKERDRKKGARKRNIDRLPAIDTDQGLNLQLLDAAAVH